ncbi:MAG: fibro-slime domain-containing protein [Planctomycetes bacterium]|nr:fibro-slime domain-containing protein [Planctomycetota bacterium]
MIRFRHVKGFMASGQHSTLDNVQVQGLAAVSDPFGGALDEVRVFMRQLTESDFAMAGGFVLDSPRLDSSGRPIGQHLEQDGAPCFAAGDTPAPVGTTSNAGITSRTSFAEWFRDAPGTNLSMAHPITLANDGLGVYEHLTDDFYPCDDCLLGNEGETHNQFYTYSFTATFAYSQCTSQFFEFAGGDGAWMFIDDDLAIDLGGTGTSSGQYVELDRFGLVDGQAYTLRFFYAQRWDGNAIFRMRTNLLLSGSSGGLTSGVFD